MIDQLTANEVISLARFVEAYRRLRGTSNWRTQFYECVRRRNFLPYVTHTDAEVLTRMVAARGAVIVCLIRTREVLRAAQSEAVAG